MSKTPKPSKKTKDKSDEDARASAEDGATVGVAHPARGGGDERADEAPDLSGDSQDDEQRAKALGPHLQALFAVAETYGQRSFDNYAQIRSVAENIRDQLCAWLKADGPCVFLVPPEGRFSAQNYQSAAFSVAGQGYLPLKPISFGLAVLVSEDKDFMRIVITCRKEGDAMFIRLEKGDEIRLNLPVTDASFPPVLEAIYAYLTDFFQDRIDDYDNGRYGLQEIGFDIQRMTA